MEHQNLTFLYHNSYSITAFAKYKEGTDVHRHSKDRGTPFAVYMGLYVFAKIRR